MEENPTEVSKGLGGEFWGSVVTGATGVFNGLNFKAQDKQIELANAQAEIARANAEATPVQSNKTVIAIAIVIAVIAVAYFFRTKK